MLPSKAHLGLIDACVLLLPGIAATTPIHVVSQHSFFGDLTLQAPQLAGGPAAIVFFFFFFFFTTTNRVPIPSHPYETSFVCPRCANFWDDPLDYRKKELFSFPTQQILARSKKRRSYSRSKSSGLENNLSPSPHPDPRVHWTVRGRGRNFECMDDRAGFEYRLRCPWRSETVDRELFVLARRQAFQRWVVRLSATNRSWVSPYGGKSVQGLCAAVHVDFIVFSSLFECSLSGRLDLLDWMSFLSPFFD